MSFEKGDHVFFPRHGVGEVIGVSKQKAGGETEQCLGVQFPKQNMSLYIPVDRLDGVRLRKVMGRNKASKVFESLKGRARFNTDRSHKERVRFYQDKFDTGDPLELSDIARDLARLSKKQDLTMDEENLCRNSIDLLSREIAVTRKKMPAEIRQLIEDVIYR